MRAIRIQGVEGLASLSVVDVEQPKPSPTEIWINVKAAGINFAELELIQGKYPPLKPFPYILGFEAAGTVASIGSQVKNFAVGDRVAALVSSGGYAEYASADSNAAFRIPRGVSFAEATSIPVQGFTAYSLLKIAARLQPRDSVLIQAAAGVSACSSSSWRRHLGRDR